MSLIAILVALLAQSAWPVRDPNPLAAACGRLCLSAGRRLDAGDRNSGILGWFVLMGLVGIPAAVVLAIALAIHPALAWIFDAAVAYAALRFLATTRNIGSLELLLRQGKIGAAAQKLAAWQGSPVEGEDPGEIARLAAEQGLREAHYGTFGPLFWFLVLPGPLGLLLYPLAHRAARTWQDGLEPRARDFGWFAARAFEVADWLPRRLTAFAFAMVGDFEDAFYCWRTQAPAWAEAEEGIVLASGAGALGYRLGEAITQGGQRIERPTLGTGEPAREDALASLGGLLWRTLVLWMVVFLLAAAMRLA